MTSLFWNSEDPDGPCLLDIKTLQTQWSSHFKLSLASLPFFSLGFQSSTVHFSMISLVVFLCLATSALAQWQNQPQWQNNNNHYQPQQHQPQSSHNNPAPVHYVNIGAQLQGDYKFGYNTGNDGSFREETRNPDGSVSGAYGYIDGSGKQKIIKYTAGKDGFKAEGDDIPKAPPAPLPVAPQPSYQPQPQYNPAPYQPPAPQHQPQPQYNNYIQPQASQGYSQYSPAQQYGAPQQSSSYNPFAYHNPAPGQGVGNSLNQLSYNIGGGQQGHHQG